MTTRVLTMSSIKMFVRNRQALFFTLVMPFIFIGIFGLIGFDKVPTIDLGVVTARPSAATSQFVNSLEKIDALKIHRGAEDEERTALQKGDRALVMIVPDALFPDPTAAARPTTQTVRLLQNVAQAQQAGTAQTIISQIFDKTSLELVKAPTFFNLKVESINAKKVKYIDLRFKPLAQIRKGIYGVPYDQTIHQAPRP